MPGESNILARESVTGKRVVVRLRRFEQERQGGGINKCHASRPYQAEALASAPAPAHPVRFSMSIRVERGTLSMQVLSPGRSSRAPEALS